MTGGVFTLVGAIGMLRFPDFYMRLHAPTKATTLGVGGVLLASMVAAWWRGQTGAPELMITLFLFITAPVSASLMAKAAIHLGLLLLGHVPGLWFLHLVQFVGVNAMLVADYCLLARLLVLLPWNRGVPLSARLVRQALFSAPAPGAIHHRLDLCSARDLG